MVDGQVDYYSFFGLEQRLTVDLKALRMAYYQKSLALHPDHNDAVDEVESAANNRAYKTLQDWDTRVKYTLDTFGGDHIDPKAALSPMFLMEMMDLNEKVEDASADQRAELNPILEEALSQNDAMLEGKMEKDFGEWVMGDWKVLNEYYLQRRYLLRLRKNLDKFADPKG